MLLAKSGKSASTVKIAWAMFSELCEPGIIVIPITYVDLVNSLVITLTQTAQKSSICLLVQMSLINATLSAFLKTNVFAYKIV